MKKILIILFCALLFSSCDEKTKTKKDKRTSQVMEKYYESQLCECAYKNGPTECMDLWKKYEKKTGKQGDDLECIVEAMMDMEESPAEEIVENAAEQYYESQLCECAYKNGPTECMDLWKEYEKKTGKQGDDLECIVEAMMDMEESPAEEIVEYAEEEYYDDEFEEEVYYDKEYNSGWSIFEGDFVVESKGSWDHNTTVSATSSQSGERISFYYSAWYDLGETRGLFEDGISWDELVEGEGYRIKYSQRNWVENYETGGWSMGNFIISVETMLD